MTNKMKKKNKKMEFEVEVAEEKKICAYLNFKMALAVILLRQGRVYAL